MTDDRISGIALIAGSIASIITMSLHPTGHDLLTPGRFQDMERLAKAVHALALLSLPIFFFGAYGLSRRLKANSQLALAALVTYGFALVAVMNAAVCSGLIAPSVASRMLDANAVNGDLWRALFRFTGDMNQAFALVFVMAASCAIVFWSVAIFRSKVMPQWLARYGCVIAPVTMLAVGSGHIRLDVHGFGAIVLGQAIWFVGAGIGLCKAEAPITDSPTPTSEVPVIP
jgi:hypothetical protein